MSTDLTDAQFVTLQNLVTLAKTEQIRTLAALKARAAELGHSEEDITAACLFWAEDLHARYPDARDLLRSQSPLMPEPRVFPEKASIHPE